MVRTLDGGGGRGRVWMSREVEEEGEGSEVDLVESFFTDLDLR